MKRVYTSMGVCPQHDLLWETLTAREHLLFYGRLKNLKGPALHRAVEESLRSVNLLNGGVADKQAGKYSGGMKRRLSVAISLIGDPKVVYMDEPSTGLDPASRSELWKVVMHLLIGGREIGKGTKGQTRCAENPRKSVVPRTRARPSSIVADSGGKQLRVTPRNVKGGAKLKQREMVPNDAIVEDTPPSKIAKNSLKCLKAQENHDVEGSSKTRARFGSVPRGFKAKHPQLDVVESTPKRTRFDSVARGIKAKHPRSMKPRVENMGEMRETAYRASLRVLEDTGKICQCHL
ncbi:uncharacterized protein LOC131299530 [Rhododendron vialii]|uniref:uncharacterized protein LOC131299530 n=1 Tax=Rhododendron vialii TaxID=182163 RepID=UPI00265DB1C4|nr:uncharacterized protein LOC131299530 [Rhododendron vialii]